MDHQQSVGKYRRSRLVLVQQKVDKLQRHQIQRGLPINLGHSPWEDGLALGLDQLVQSLQRNPPILPCWSEMVRWTLSLTFHSDFKLN